MAIIEKACFNFMSAQLEVAEVCGPAILAIHDQNVIVHIVSYCRLPFLGIHNWISNAKVVRGASEHSSLQCGHVSLQDCVN